MSCTTTCFRKSARSDDTIGVDEGGDTPGDSTPPNSGTPRSSGTSSKGRYPGDFINWNRPWPRYKRMEFTSTGVAFWASVRREMEMEFVRKAQVTLLKQTRANRKRVTWSKSVESTERLRALRVSFVEESEMNLWMDKIPFFKKYETDEVDLYRADKKTWEMGQRLLAEDGEMFDSETNMGSQLELHHPSKNTIGVTTSTNLAVSDHEDG